MSRAAPWSGAVSVSLTSSSTRSLIEPPRPRSLMATEVTPTSGIRQAATTRGHAHPAAKRASAAPSARARRSRPGRRAKSTTTISSTSRPKSPATLSLEASGWSVFENGSRASAHAPTAPAAAAGARSTGRLRRRRGTRANQSTDADRGRGQCAARLGEQDGQDRDAHARVGQRSGEGCCRCGVSRATAGRERPARPWCPRHSSTGTARRCGWTARWRPAWRARHARQGRRRTRPRRPGALRRARSPGARGTSRASATPPAKRNR